MLTADSDLETVRAGREPRRRHVDELSDPFAVQRDERVLVKKVHPRVVDQEGRLRVIG